VLNMKIWGPLVCLILCLDSVSWSISDALKSPNIQFQSTDVRVVLRGRSVPNGQFQWTCLAPFLVAIGVLKLGQMRSFVQNVEILEDLTFYFGKLFN
jgi:hypothetical protein